MKVQDQFILDDDMNVVPAKDREEWGEFMNDRKNRHLMYDENDKYKVSTVFLGINHGLGAGNAPIVFETMVFKNNPSGSLGVEEECSRYTTWKEAFDGHMKMCNQWLKEDSPFKE
jgi:hypothetical protein